jgi:glycosyltransferase involved in cell wall biosynthesis
MRIGYFSYLLGTKGGPAIADLKVLEAISEYDKTNRYTVYGLTPRAVSNLRLKNDNIKTKTISPSGKWLGIPIGMPMELKRNPVDLLHATFVPPLFVPCKYVLTTGCWSQYSEPDVYPRLVRWRFLFLTNKGIKNASAVFCYTEYLRNKVIERFKIPPERVFITKPGVGEEIKPVEDEEELRGFLKRRGIDFPYILFVGAITRRKNIIRLLQAYDILRREGPLDHKLVLLGERTYFSDEIMQTVTELKLEHDVVFIDRHPHHELPYFYTGADVFVFPTLSEGFGMPPLEAMACGTPVLASNVTSVPEVVGDSALLVDPYRPEEIAKKIHQYLTDDALRKQNIDKGLVHAREFTWHRAAVQTVSAYETVLEAGW